MKKRFLYGGMLLSAVVFVALASADTLAKNDDSDQQADKQVKQEAKLDKKADRLILAQLRREKRMAIVDLIVDAKDSCGTEFGAGTKEARDCLHSEVKTGLVAMLKAIRDARADCRDDDANETPLQVEICTYSTVFDVEEASPSPSASPTASATASASPTASATATVSPTASATASASPTASATANP